jgi:hypothetical protein
MIYISGFRARNERETMTKKDYQIIAEALASSPEGHGVEGLLNWGDTCRHMARALAAENPRFNTVTFLGACGFDMAFGAQWRQEFAN